MAIARVATGVTASSTSTPATTQASPTFNTTAGNAVVVFLSGFSNVIAVSSVTDTSGSGTYTAVPNARATSATVGQIDCYINTNVGTKTGNVVTVTWALAVGFRSVAALPYSKSAGGVWVVDGGTATAAATANPATAATVAASKANNVFCAAYADDAGAGPTAGANYTLNTSVAGWKTEDDINTALTTQTGAFVNSAGPNWLVNLAVLSEAILAFEEDANGLFLPKDDGYIVSIW